MSHQKCTISKRILAVPTLVYFGIICLSLTKASVSNNYYQRPCMQTNITEALQHFLDSVAFNNKEECVRVMCAPKYKRPGQLMTLLDPYAKTTLGNSAMPNGYVSSSFRNSAMPNAYVSSNFGNSAMPNAYVSSSFRNSAMPNAYLSSNFGNSAMPNAYVSSNLGNSAMPNAYVSSNFGNSAMPNAYVSSNFGNSAMPNAYVSSNFGNSAKPGGLVPSASKAFNELASIMEGRWFVITDARGNPIGVSPQEDVKDKYPGYDVPTRPEPSYNPNYNNQYNNNPIKQLAADYSVCCSTVESYFINDTMKDITGATRTLAQIQHIGSYQIIRHGFCGRQGVCPGVCEQVYVTMPLAIVPNDPGQIVTYRYFNIPGYCSCKVPANRF